MKPEATTADREALAAECERHVENDLLSNRAWIEGANRILLRAAAALRAQAPSDVVESEEPDYSFNDHAIGMLVYKNNSVSWWHSKAENYKAALGRAWDAMIAAGFPPDGKTELSNAIAAALPTIAEARAGALEDAKPLPVIEFHQQDWIPGFAAFLPDETTASRAFCVLDVGGLMAVVESGDVPISELPYIIAETMMHEIIHVLEQWAGVEFNEDRVEALLEKYRAAAAKSPSAMPPPSAA